MKVSELNTPVETSKKEKQPSILNRDIQLFSQRIPDKDKAVIYRQLNVLQKSGVDIKTSFDILQKQIRNKKTREKLKGVLSLVIKGKSLSDAMGEYSDFSLHEVYSLKIGEETGRLTVVLAKLAEYFDNKIAQRRQVISALSYPVLIVFTSIGAVSFMVFFIIPMFEEVFLRFNSELPTITQYVIGFSKGVKTNAPGAILIVGIIVGVIYYLRNNEMVRWVREWLILKTPVAGQIYKEVYLARFCDSMGLLIASSIPMVTTLDMVRKMIGFLHLERPIEQVKNDLVTGKGIAEALEGHTIFDDQMKALIKVGEEVNQLADFFQKMASDYSESVRHRTSLLSTFLEPLMIVFLGLIVGVILVAMYLPMFELSSSMDFGN